MDKFAGLSLSSKDRFFPPISSTLYKSSEIPHSHSNFSEHIDAEHFEFSADGILGLAFRSFTRWQLWTGRELNEIGLLARILWLHKNLLDDELNGHWKRADFYWREIIKSLKNMQAIGLWQQLDTKYAQDNNIKTDGSIKLSSCIIKELLIDSNLALFNGRLELSETNEPDTRAATYATNIQTLLPLANLAEAEHWFIAEYLADIIIEKHRKRSQFQSVIEHCKLMVRDFPDRSKYQDVWVEIEVQAALSALQNKEDPQSNLDDASRLQKCINNLAELSRKYPCNPSIYDSLGYIHQLLSIKFANGGKLTLAILAIEESLAYTPGVTEAEEIRDQLRTTMQELQARFKELEKELANNPGATLNADGERLRSQAKEGAKSADQFIESGRAASLTSLAQRAHAVRFWQDAELGGSDEQIAESALLLRDAIQSNFYDFRENPELIKDKLIQITNRIPEIGEQECELLTIFLKKHLVPQNIKKEENNSDTDSTSFPILLPLNKNEITSKEPAGMWLFSSEALSTKIFAGTSLIVMVISFAMLVWDEYRTAFRNQAYEAIIKAVNSEDPQAITTAANQFIAFKGFRPDSRQNQIENFQELPNQWIRDVAYQDLIIAVDFGNPERVIKAAEAFFSAPPVQIRDHRQTDVIEAYNKAFVSWFISLTDLDNPATQHRINTYKNFSENINKGGNQL